ncbi:MAG: SpoIID/LytB domain-containing protein, partial [Planctomycetota bacterium]
MAGGKAEPAGTGRRGRLLSLLTGLVASACALGPGACARKTEIPPAPGGVPTIRVLLFAGRDRTEVRIPGPYRVVLRSDAAEPEELASGDELGATEVTCQHGDVTVERVVVRAPGTVEFLPQGVPFELDGRRYRGSLRVSPSGGGLRAINVVDLEGYVRGVVPGEMYPDWPAAALRAQAVAARTYALARMRARRDRSYDVVSTPADQHYLGLEGETKATSAAVAATAGGALHHQGWPLAAYYHACCGGRTADPLAALGDPRSPIRPVRCPYCKGTRYFEWSRRISRARVLDRLGIPGAVGLRVAETGADGRVRRVDVLRSGRRPVSLTGPTFRERVGTGAIRSAWFRARRDGDEYVFAGFGFGHGVGMCQWGAKGMADAGKTYRDVLAKYYPGTRLKVA